MAEGKKTFVAYTNWMATFEKLTDEEAGRLIKHLFRYVNDLDPEPPDRMIELVFEQFKQILKVDLDKWESIRERNKINGAKGGRPKKEKEPKKPTGLIGNPKKPRKADNDNDNDNDISIKRESVNDWKKSFEEYKNQVREAFIEAIQDKTWMQKQQEYYPNINIKKSLEKACFNYWATEAGWQNKRSKRTKTINWKTTFGNALAMKENHVYNDKNSFYNEKEPGIEI
jgi:hypothetical protein